MVLPSLASKAGAQLERAAGNASLVRGDAPIAKPSVVTLSQLVFADSEWSIGIILRMDHIHEERKQERFLI